jgi:predicted dehydrogenase
MLLNMIHEIGIMRMMFGEIESVFAMSGNDRRGFPVEDTVSIALRFCNGAFGSFALSDVTASTKSWEMTTGENPAYPIIQDQNCYHLAGTNGSLDFPSMVARTYGTGPRSWWVRQQEWSIGVAVKEPLALQVAHFVDVIRGHALPMVSIEDGYRNLLVLDAMTTSARTSRPILVEAVERELINSVPSQVQL